MGQWQTHTTQDLVTDPVLVTYARAPEAPPPPPSLGFVTSDAHPAAVTSALGSYPPGQSESSPSGPSLALQFSIPTDGTPKEWYQCLAELA